MPEFLNWRTDPWLIDNTPDEENQWLTANKLIEQQAHNRLFLQPNIINIYSIMVRKVDFLSGERLLQRLPYITLPDTLALQIRKNSLLLAEHCHYYFQKTALEYSIKKWQQKIIDYTEKQKRLPFPLFRLSDSWEKILTQEYVKFQSARGEHFHMPTGLASDLAYILGMVIGDGHLNYHNIELVDFSQEHMVMLQALAKKIFGIEGNISGENRVWLLHLNNKWLVRMVNFLTDQPITGKKYHALREPLIFVSYEKLRWEFWSGVIDADGSFKKQISLCSASERFINAFSKLLQEFNIQYKQRINKSKYGNSYEIRILAISKPYIRNYLKPRHKIKQKEYSNYLSQKQYAQRKPIKNQNIVSYNPKSIIKIHNESYFNFELVQNLCVVNGQGYLIKMRHFKGWTQQDLADILNIPKSKLASFEYRKSLPIKFLLQLFPFFQNPPSSFMVFLDEEKLRYFRSRKTVARLDLQPNEKLLSIMQNFEIRQKYLAINYSKEKLKEFYATIGNYFSVPPPKTNQFTNSVILQFAKTFFKTTSQNV